MKPIPFQYADQRGEIHYCKVNEKSTFDVQFINGNKATLSFTKFLKLKEDPPKNRIAFILGVKE